MGCISSAPVEPAGDEFEGDPLAELKRRKRDLENDVRGAREYGQALLASQADLLGAQHAKEEEAIADLVKAAISKGEITAITAAEFDLLRGAAASC